MGLEIELSEMGCSEMEMEWVHLEEGWGAISVAVQSLRLINSMNRLIWRAGSSRTCKM